MTPDVFMRRALALAELGRGRTSPNPIVGAVLVVGDELVGEGWHHAPGQPHAEIEALIAAGDRARGATLYCTLEPCCHTGRTGPCTEALIAAGVAKVVYAVDDPDPLVSGGGAAALRAAGVAVESGLLADEVGRALEAYLHHRRTGRPLVTAKWAMTLDGKLATASGDSRWVSGDAALKLVHELRNQVDAVLVGAGTVSVDNPSLTCRREGECHHPIRVVADSRGRTPARAKVYTDGLAPTWLAVVQGCAPKSRPGAEIIELPEVDGELDLRALLDELGRRGVVEVLSEAGGRLNGSLLREGLVNKVMAVVAPKMVGGSGPSPWDGDGLGSMAGALKLDDLDIQRVGDEVVIRGRVCNA